MNPLLKQIAGVVAGLGLAGWISTFVYFAHLQGTSPTYPRPSTGQTVEERNHHERFYVTSTQDDVLQYGRVGTFTILAIGIGIGWLAGPDQKKTNQPPEPTAPSGGGAA